MASLIFEFKRIFKDRKVLLVVAFILGLSLFYTSSGIDEYYRILEKKEIFKKYEMDRIKVFQNLKQMAAYGFRVFYQPSPLMVFFANSTVLREVESNVDLSERVNIFDAYKGKELFNFRGDYQDFSSTLFLFGSLFMLYMGVGVIKSKEFFLLAIRKRSFAGSFWGALLFRLFWLDLIFLLINAVVFIFALCRGLPLLSSLTPFFLHFVLYGLLFLNFFYFAGFLIRLLASFKLTSYLGIILFWILSMFFIPEICRTFLQEDSQLLNSNVELDLENLTALMASEEKIAEATKNTEDPEKTEIKRNMVGVFLEKESQKTKEREQQLSSDVKRIVDKYEGISMLYPSLYYTIVCNEISSEGYMGYLDFLEYILDMRVDLLGFYFKHYYILKTKEILSFIKGDEGFFQARNYVPPTYWYGVLVILVYCVLLCLWAYVRLKKLVYRG